MNTKTTATAPSPGELAEQRHLVDPLDHVLEHLADEQHPVSARNELRDCFLSDNRDRFETAADAYRAEVLREASGFLAEVGENGAAYLLRTVDVAPTNGSPAPLSSQREAEIRAFEENEHRNVLTMGRDLDDLLAEVDRLRAELAALPAPTIEHGFRDADGQAWPTKGLPARTAELILDTNFRLQRTVRYGEWTEVTA